MANSIKCCFGLIDVHRGAEVIATSIVRVLILSIIGTVLILLTFPRGKSNFQHQFLENQNNILVICNWLFVLFILCLFLYININLKKATQETNVQNIQHWLVFHIILAIFFMLCIGFYAIYTALELIVVGILISALHGFLVHVVKCYYDEEVNSLGNGLNSTSLNIVSVSSPVVNAVQVGQGFGHATLVNVSETQIPEHINPPAYSATYNKPEGPSIKK